MTKRWPLLALAALGLGKLLLLAVVGPSLQEDSGLYVAYADAILGGSGFAPVPWGADAVPPTIFRLAGYPLALAAAKLVAPAHFAVVIVVAQIVLALAAIALVFRVLAPIFRSRAAAFAACALYGLSSAVLWDNAILVDSLYASLFTIVLFALLGHAAGVFRLPLWAFAALGLAWAYSTWLRDSGLYFTFLPLILLAVAAVAERRGGMRRAAPAALFLAVVAAMTGGYMELNRYRTGELFFGITGVENWLRPAFDMAADGYAWPFADDGLVSTTVRATMTHFDFPAQEQFVAALHARCGCTPLQIEALERAKLIAVVREHPVAYLRVVLRNFNYLGLGSNLADPVAILNQVVEYGTSYGARLVPGPSLRNLRAFAAGGRLAGLAGMGLAALSTAVSAALFTLFLFGLPVTGWLAWRRGAVPPGLYAALFLWVTFVAVSFAFSLIHYESRHALPVLPAAAAGIAYMLLRVGWLRDRPAG